MIITNILPENAEDLSGVDSMDVHRMTVGAVVCLFMLLFIDITVNLIILIIIIIYYCKCLFLSFLFLFLLLYFFPPLLLLLVLERTKIARNSPTRALSDSRTASSNH